jgi:hypothetical protein
MLQLGWRYASGKSFINVHENTKTKAWYHHLS